MWNRTGPDRGPRSGPVRSDSFVWDRTGPDRTGPKKTGPDRSGPVPHIAWELLEILPIVTPIQTLTPRNSETVTPILKIEPSLAIQNTNKMRYQALYVLPELSYRVHRKTEKQTVNIIFSTKSSKIAKPSYANLFFHKNYIEYDQKK